MIKIQPLLPLVQSVRKGKPSQVVLMADLVEGQGSKGAKPKGFVVRFNERVKRGEPESCWPWTGKPDRHGYGKITIGTKGKNRKHYLAHRVAYIIHHGALPEDLRVCHTCDNPICVNPGHLFLGTAKDNTHDALNKNRLSHGESHPQATIPESDVSEIRIKFASGAFSQREIADIYGVRPNTVSRIVNFKRRRVA